MRRWSSILRVLVSILSMSKVSVRMLFLLFALSLASPIQSSSLPRLVQTSVLREVTLSSNVERSKVFIEVRNSMEEAAEKYYLALRRHEADRLSYALALFDSADETKFSEFQMVRQEEQHSLFQVEFPKALHSGESIRFQLRLAFVHPTEPLPRIVGQADPIYARYSGNAKFYSPFETKGVVKTTFELGTSEIKDFTPKISGVSSKQAQAVVYQFNSETSEPFDAGVPVSLHFRATKPFVTMKRMVKEFEVSHWGNVYIQEEYEIVNSAAEFTGSFSRLDHMQRGNPDPAHTFEALTASLPASAYDVYYRDFLGNVTTSNFRQGKRSSTLQIRTRYPLMPSWNTDFYISYNVPSQDLMVFDSKDGRMNLNLRFGSSFKSAIVEDCIVRVILPEGALDIDAKVPFAVNQSDLQYRYTYLDTTGRPMIEFKKSNAIAFHNKNFLVSYSFPTYFILREPLYLVVGFFSFFLVFIAYFRIVVSFSSSQGSASSLKTSEEDLFLQACAKVLSCAEQLSSAFTQNLDTTIVSEKLVESLKELEDRDRLPQTIKDNISELRGCYKELKKIWKKQHSVQSAQGQKALSNFEKATALFR